MRRIELEWRATCFFDRVALGGKPGDFSSGLPSLFELAAKGATAVSGLMVPKLPLVRIRERIP